MKWSSTEHEGTAGRTTVSLASTLEPRRSSAQRRVVIEHEDTAWQVAASRALERAGFEVVCCDGPNKLRHRGCPLLAGRPCELVDSADVVINGLGLRDAPNRDLLTTMRRTHPGLALVVEAPRRDLAEYPDIVADCEALAFPIRSAKVLVETAADAVDARRASPPRSCAG